MFFESLFPDSHREFVIHERTEVSFRNFRPMLLGRWNLPDPEFVPQYATFFCQLSEERIDQQRSFGSVFSLVESIGASLACFYFAIYLFAR
eukprot:1620846-Prymnesium_polylepis.2